MSRRPGQRDVLYEGGPALKELIETYATMDIKAFCAKWDLAIATVRSTASRRGLLRLRVKVPKKDTANTVKPTARRGRKPKYATHDEASAARDALATMLNELEAALPSIEI